MSWSIFLSTDRKVSRPDFDRACLALSESGVLPKSHFHPSKQDWGWSLGVDVSNPSESGVSVGGAGYSRSLGYPSASVLKTELEKAGYAVKASRRHD